MKFKNYLNEDNGKWGFVDKKVEGFIKLYKDIYPNYKVYSGSKIKQVISWNPLTILSVNDIRTKFKGNIINALFGRNEREFTVLVLKRDDVKDIIVLGTLEPLPLQRDIIKLEEMAKGWDKDSIKKFSGTIGKTPDEKGFFDACVLKMKGDVDNPEGYCANLIDEWKGTTNWRGKGHKE